MLNILDKYGIKEVADVIFYELNDDGKIGNPVLILDTLKVSSINQTSDEHKYYGGKGDSLLISWQSKKEITITLQDALFSMKSLAILLGGTPREKEIIIKKTDIFVATDTALPIEGGSGWNNKIINSDGEKYTKINPVFFDKNKNKVTKLKIGERYICSYEVNINSLVIDVFSNFNDKKYCVIGETYIRSEKDGTDESFYFIIPKASISSNIKLDLEAEGDPSVFDMELKALKMKNLPLMQLVRNKTMTDYSETSEQKAIIGKAILENFILGMG